jgi:tetratricopeptide (TPR) repeat protein
MKVIDTFIVKQDSIAKLNFGKAETFYFKCLNIAPDSFAVYQELMDLYVYTENFNKAEGLYDSIRTRFQSDSLLGLLSSSLANAYSTSREYKKALIFYEKMLTKDTSDTYIQYQIAFINEKLGKYKKAIKEYNRIIQKDSSYIQAYIQLGGIYYEKYSKYKVAKKYIQIAYDRELGTYGNTYYVDLPYYLGLIAVKERKTFEAMMYYMDLKSIYTYTPEDNKKKADLLKALRELN